MKAGETPLLTVRGLAKHFPLRQGLFGRQVGAVRALDGVDLDLARGEAVGLVGESGCGKTTCGRALLRLIEPTAGSVHFAGIDVLAARGAALRGLRRRMQMVFQDPYASLNARLTIGEALTEPLLVHGLASDHNDAWRQAAALLQKVGLEPSHLDRWPDQFSGGQRQRIGIARALAVQPELLVLDEPVSALDVSVQATVINLLKDLQEQLGLSYLFIAHDLAVVAQLCSRVVVMYLGRIVEEGPVDRIFAHPLHPYTQALLSAVPPEAPGQGQRRILLRGDPPSPMQAWDALRLAARFDAPAEAFAGDERLREAGPGHRVRCSRLDILEDCAARRLAAV
jgi:oligopeptide/dipeptide ABC transporter ATP-binding protein